MNINHIVFDIGRVLIHWDPEIPYKRLIPDEEERNWFFENVCTSEWNLEQDRGRPWKEAEDLLIGQFPDQEHLIRAFRQNWHDMVPHSHDRSVELMTRLIEAGHDVTLLTNFASDTFAEVRERFGFLKLPRGATVSGDIKLIKPDPAIYTHHARTFDLDPKLTLFVDDSEKNVLAARNAGWQAIHLLDPPMIEAGFARYGF